MMKRPTKTETGVPQDGADVDHGGPRNGQLVTSRADGERARMHHYIDILHGMLRSLKSGLAQPGALSNEAQGFADMANRLSSCAARCDAYALAELDHASSKEISHGRP